MQAGKGSVLGYANGGEVSQGELLYNFLSDLYEVQTKQRLAIIDYYSNNYYYYTRNTVNIPKQSRYRSILKNFPDNTAPPPLPFPPTTHTRTATLRPGHQRGTTPDSIGKLGPLLTRELGGTTLGEEEA